MHGVTMHADADNPQISNPAEVKVSVNRWENTACAFFVLMLTFVINVME